MNNKKELEIDHKTFKINEFYGWVEDDNNAILHLGKMKKAVIIRKILNKEKVFISEASYFPFSNEIYNERFDDFLSAKNLAITYITEWFQATLNSSKNSHNFIKKLNP